MDDQIQSAAERLYSQADEQGLIFKSDRKDRSEVLWAPDEKDAVFGTYMDTEVEVSTSRTGDTYSHTFIILRTVPDCDEVHVRLSAKDAERWTDTAINKGDLLLLVCITVGTFKGNVYRKYHWEVNPPEGEKYRNFNTDEPIDLDKLDDGDTF